MCRIRVTVRCQTRRRLHQSAQNSRLGNGYFTRRFAKIFSRRALNAISARAEINPVQIEFENLVLGKFALKPQRQNRFLNFPRCGSLLRQKEIFCELLRQRRAALHPSACMEYIAQQSARNPHRVNAKMAVEPMILNGDERLRQIFRKFVKRHLSPTGFTAIGKQGAIRAENGNIRRTLWNSELVNRRQLGRIKGNQCA